MRNRRTLLLTVVGVALAFTALFAINRNSHEPSYDGRPLSYWVSIFGDLHSIEEVQYEKATNAVNQIGVASLPFLLKWIQYEPPKWRSRLGGWVSQTSLTFADRFYDWITEPRALRLSLGTGECFHILGNNRPLKICVSS